MNTTLSIWLNLIVFTAAGAYILSIGLRGLRRQKPVLIAGRYLMVCLFICLLPLLYHILFPLFHVGEYTQGQYPFIAAVKDLLILVVFVFIFWRQFSGYMFFGITRPLMHDALRQALTDQNLAYQEKKYYYRLTQLQAYLVAIMAPWLGVAQVSIEPRQHQDVLKRVVGDVRGYFEGTPVWPNRKAFVLYMVLGAITIVGALVFNLLVASGVLPGW
jgi:hypothetical protein